MQADANRPTGSGSFEFLAVRIGLVSRLTASHGPGPAAIFVYWSPTSALILATFTPWMKSGILA